MMSDRQETFAGKSMLEDSAVGSTPSGGQGGFNRPATIEKRVALPMPPQEAVGDGRGESCEAATVRTVLVTNPQGLHLRACSDIVNTVEQHRARVTVRKGDHSENAASILGLMGLAVECGTELVLAATGPEAEDVLQAIGDLLAAGNEDLSAHADADRPSGRRNASGARKRVAR